MEHVSATFIIIFQIALGVSLAACAGLRAFLPILVVGILSRMGYLEAGEHFAWIGSTPALIVFGVATISEILADKFPVVDHFLDSAGVIVKPIAGFILFSTVVVKMDPVLLAVCAIIAGGGISELVHLKKTALRLASSAISAGAANPIVSTIEDISAVLGVIVSVVAPVIAFFVISLGLYLGFRFFRKRIEKKKAKLQMKKETEGESVKNAPHNEFSY